MYSVSIQFSSLWPLDTTLSDATTPSQNRPGSDSNERVPKSPALLKPHRQTVWCHKQDTHWGSFTSLQKCSQCILQSQLTGPTSVEERSESSIRSISAIIFWAIFTCDSSLYINLLIDFDGMSTRLRLSVVISFVHGPIGYNQFLSRSSWHIDVISHRVRVNLVVLAMNKYSCNTVVLLQVQGDSVVSNPKVLYSDPTFSSSQRKYEVERQVERSTNKLTSETSKWHPHSHTWIRLQV